MNTSSSGITASQSAIGRRASGGGGGTLAAAATGQSDLQHHNQLELDDFRMRQPMEVLELGERHLDLDCLDDFGGSQEKEGGSRRPQKHTYVNVQGIVCKDITCRKGLESTESKTTMFLVVIRHNTMRHENVN